MNVLEVCAQATSPDEILDAIHAHWREFDTLVWHMVAHNGPPPAMIVPVAHLPQSVTSHPRFEDYQLGDEGARLDVETGAYEAVRPVTSGDVVLDVGAHVGYFAAKALAKQAMVYAIEPDPRNVRMLARRMLEYPELIRAIIPAAAGDHPELVELHRSAFSHQHTLGAPIHHVLSDFTPAPVRVPMVRIDDLALCPSFLKLDVEGAELAALRGAHSTISAFRPFIVAEVLDDLVDIAALLAHHGYRKIWATPMMHLPPVRMATPAPGLWHCEP